MRRRYYQEVRRDGDDLVFTISAGKGQPIEAKRVWKGALKYVVGQAAGTGELTLRIPRQCAIDDAPWVPEE